MHSKIYAGQVSHRRLKPHKHQFNYTMFMMYLDLDELPVIFTPYFFWSSEHFNLAYFNRKDHMGDSSQSLKQSVIDLVFKKTNIQLNGPIRLLTHLRYFGYGFNPVSFYYCFNEQDSDIEVIVAEVNNTPWGEQFCYIFPNNDNDITIKKHRYEFKKKFHVSPFNPMEQNYKWAISLPQQHLSVHIENWRNNEKIFEASLSLEAEVINSTSLRKTLTRFPLITIKVISAIYYQAFKLWVKGTPFYSHPKSSLQSQIKHK